MNKDVNYQMFDLTTANGKKHFFQLLETLIDYNNDSEEKYYNDIHIYQEDMFSVIEWNHIPYSHEYGGEFKYIAEDEVIMKEVYFPDNHYEFLFPEEVDERFKEWLEENPGWTKTSYGTWTNTIENEKFRKEFEQLKEENKEK